MKKLALAFGLVVAAVTANAQGIPVTGGYWLQSEVAAVVAQIAADNWTKHSLNDAGRQSGGIPTTDMTPPPRLPRSCLYDGKPSSEGAIRSVDGVMLVCVERDWGVISLGHPRELVWEPVTSKRISAFTEVTGLAPATR